MRYLPLILAFSLPLAAQSRAFVLVNALQVPAIVLDVESTQHCIHAGLCREGNPLMPTSRGRAYAVDFSLLAVEDWGALRLRKGRKRWWWSPPAAAGSVHLWAGLANAVRFGW